MAENNHLSYRGPTAARNVSTPPREQPDDPLAELARLIGQSVTMNDLTGDTRRFTSAGSRSRRKFNPPTQHGCDTPDSVLLETSEEQYSVSEQGSYDFDPPNDTHGDRRYEPLPRAPASRQSRSAWHEHEPQSHPDTADLYVESSGGRYDEYEDQSHDQPDNYAYGQDYEEDPKPRLRARFIFVAAAFGLALLGSGGAFVYRALLADSIVPPLLSTIKAEGSPNKITASQGSAPPQSDADKAASSAEERPVDAPPPVSTAPQPVSTPPSFPEPPPVPGPGAASVFPTTQPAPVARENSFNSPPATPAPLIPSANQAAAPDTLTPTPASPTKPGPKKIRTVPMRTNQPNAADSAASQPQSVAIRPPPQQRVTKPSDTNAPLSIVPSSNDAATAAAGSARTAPLAHPAPVGKPGATEIASTAPAASGGGYAVQVLSQRNKEGLRSSFRVLQAKYPKLLGGREPTVRRADLGAKGIYYRAMVGPFASAEQANELCSSLKAGGASCIVKKN
ncbi:MAG: SPOR domain-containing protein [Xanthobacteraceae bacterium]